MMLKSLITCFLGMGCFLAKAENHTIFTGNPGTEDAVVRNFNVSGSPAVGRDNSYHGTKATRRKKKTRSTHTSKGRKGHGKSKKHLVVEPGASAFAAASKTFKPSPLTTE